MSGRKVFKSSDTQHSKHNGPVTILRQLNLNEADAEVGPMFKCCTPNGELFEAFADELSDPFEVA